MENKKATQMQMVEVAKLIPYVNNTRTHTKEQIAKVRASIREFGFLNPIIIDGQYNIIAGHARAEAAKAEGIKEAPCILVDYLTEAQKKAYIIADNKLALDAGWDEEMLKIEIETLKDMDFDLSLTGFDLGELDELFKEDVKDSIKDDDFDVDKELEKPRVSQQGDLWILGRHRLVCGDSTKPETYAQLMQGEKANLVLTDPPYNVDYHGSAGSIKNDSMEDDKFFNFLFDAFSRMEENMANDASIYVFHSDTQGLNFRSAFKKAGFYLSGCCIWVKDSLVLGRSPYQWMHEPALFGWKKSGKHNWYTGRKETTVWNFAKPKKCDLHPTMKPLQLLAYPIMNSTMTNAIVLDPFGGSGSTIMTCEQTGRIGRSIELDEKFVDVIVNRYKDIVGSSEGIKLIRDGKEYTYEDMFSEADRG